MVTHYSPVATPGASTWKRESLCGVISRIGYDPERDGTHDEQGRELGSGSSNPANVTCSRCLDLGARAALDRALIADVESLTDPGILDH